MNLSMHVRLGQLRHLLGLTLVFLLSLSAVTLAFGYSKGNDSKKTAKSTANSTIAKKADSSGKNSVRDKSVKEGKSNSKSQKEVESYPSNCSAEEPNCADKLHPETSPDNQQIFSSNKAPETPPVSDSWFDSILRAVGLSSSEKEIVESFVVAPATECPDGFKSLGGNFISDPTVSVFKDKVFIFARGTDNALYYLVLEKGKKNGWVSLGGNSISNPGSYFNKTGLFVEVTGTDGQRYYRSTTDGIAFTDWTQGTVNAKTTNSKVGIRGSAVTLVKGKGENPPLCYLVDKTKKVNKTNNGNAANQKNSNNPNNSTSMNLMRSESECDWWDPWCDPNPPGDQYSPIGTFDSIDTNNRTVNGWSYDPDHPEQAIDVHIYIDGAGYAVTADLYHPNVPGNHSFSFSIPSQYVDGQQHTVYVYGIDYSGANDNAELYGSPKYFTFNPPPPDTPTWGTINSVSQTQLDVYWNGVNNATGYNVKIDGNQIYTNIPYLSAPFTNLQPGSTHSFEVQAVNQWGASGWSNSLSGTTQPPVMPATPTWGTVNTMSQTQLDVYWNQAANASAYNIKMDGNVIASNVAALMIPVTNLAPGSTHTFEVQGVNQWGVSGWSSQRSGTTQPIPVPTIASVSPQGDPTCLNLVINPVSGAVSYNVKIVANGYTANFTQTSFPWCGLSPNTYYEYQAQAVTSLGTSTWSAAVGGTTGAPPTPTPTPTPTGTPALKLSKEYIYSGSRQLATEDYGIAQPNPTPTP